MTDLIVSLSGQPTAHYLEEAILTVVGIVEAFGGARCMDRGALGTQEKRIAVNRKATRLKPLLTASSKSFRPY